MRGVAGGFHFDRTDFLLFDSHKVNFVFLFSGSSFRCVHIFMEVKVVPGGTQHLCYNGQWFMVIGIAQNWQNDNRKSRKTEMFFYIYSRK